MQRTKWWRALFGLLIVALTATAARAQTGRVGGLVRDEEGQPIKGAVVTAENSDIGNSVTATTDDRGRFNMIGLRPGTWRFIAHAPGYLADGGDLPVRAAGALNPPLTFALRRTGPGPGGPLGNRAPRDLQADLAKADALFNEGQLDEAIAAYRTIMAKTPALSVINLQIAAAYRRKQDESGALAAYTALIASDPTNEPARVGIASINLDRGDLSAAEEALKPAASAAAPGAELLLTLAEVKAAQGDANEAASWFTKAAAADGAWGKPLYRLGQLSLARGEKNAAAAFLKKAIAVDPISPEAALAKTALDELNR
jgi:thioredoxin-like negative regulator of GroEL